LQGGVPPTPTEAGNGATDDPGDLFRDRTPLPESQGHAGPSPLPKGSVIVDPGRGTPTRLLKSRVNRKLIAAFDRKRTDLEDTSSSGQDMALAAAAALEGWTDQEIADALVAAAVVNGEPVKSESYYLHTVGKARSGATAARAETEEAVAEALATAREGIQSEDAATKGGARQRLVAWIASKLGVPVTAFIRYRTTPPTYRMLMNGTSLYLGEVQTILSQRDFRVKVAALSQRVVGQMKVKLWDAVAQAILDACEEEDLDEEATEDGAVRGWLRDYLRQHRPGDADLDEKGPFWEGARIGFFQVEFAKWVWEDRNEKTTKRGLGAMLRRFGCTPYRKHFPTTDGRTTRSVWLLLPESLEPPDSVDTENAH